MTNSSLLSWENVEDGIAKISVVALARYNILKLNLDVSQYQIYRWERPQADGFLVSIRNDRDHWGKMFEENGREMHAGKH